MGGLVSTDIVHELPNSHTIYEAPRHRHQRFDLHLQVLLIRDGPNVQFKLGVPLSDIMNAIEQLHTWIMKVGNIENHLLTALLLTGLEEHLLASVRDKWCARPRVLLLRPCVHRILYEETLISFA